MIFSLQINVLYFHHIIREELTVNLACYYPIITSFHCSSHGMKFKVVASFAEGKEDALNMN